MPDQGVRLHEITIQSVRRAADELQRHGIDPETIDLPDLLQAVTEVAASRPTDGDGLIVLSLLRLAALALLWSQSVDDFSDILAGLPAVDDADIDALIADVERSRGNGPALDEGSGA